MKNLFAVFQEENGQPSSQRLVFICGSFYAMFMGAWVFGVTKDYQALIATVPAISAVFIGGKLIQKSQETKENVDVKKEETKENIAKVNAG